MVYRDFLLTSEVFLFNFSVIDESSQNWRNLPGKLFCFRHRKRSNNRLSHFLYFWFLGRVAERRKKKRKNTAEKSILSVWVKKERASEKNLTFSWWNFALFFFPPVRSTENWIICQNIYVSTGGVVSRSAMTQDFFVSILGENPSWNFPHLQINLLNFLFIREIFLFVSRIFSVPKLNRNFHNHSSRKRSAENFLPFTHPEKNYGRSKKFSLPFYRLELDHFKIHSADD